MIHSSPNSNSGTKVGILDSIFFVFVSIFEPLFDYQAYFQLLDYYLVNQHPLSPSSHTPLTPYHLPSHFHSPPHSKTLQLHPSPKTKEHLPFKLFLENTKSRHGIRYTVITKRDGMIKKSKQPLDKIIIMCFVLGF